MITVTIYKKMKNPVTTKTGSEITEINIGTYNVEQVNNSQFDNIVAEFKKNPEPTVETYYWVAKEN